MAETVRYFCRGCQSEHESDKLCDYFLSAFEDYAGRAGTPVLRERWGKVLAHETKFPGSFTRRLLRKVDEATSDGEFHDFLRQAVPAPLSREE